MKHAFRSILLSAIVAVALLAANAIAGDDGLAPDYEFKRLTESMQKSAPSQELVDTLYTFMEKWPHDSRDDQVQFWIGQVQQNRKFHNEAIKEFGFVVKEYPKSPLVSSALRAQAESYLAIDKHKEADDCFTAIVDRKPADFNADPTATRLFREAVIWLAERSMKQKEPKVDQAVALLVQLPDQRESVTRIVEVYLNVDRYDDALKTIDRLPESDHLLGYHLMIKFYGDRPGVLNLFNLLGRVIDHEKPAGPIDEIVRKIVAAMGRKDAGEQHKALERVAAQYVRLKRWAAFSLCEMDKGSDLPRLTAFVGDYRSGGDVEQCKTWIGAFYESAGDPAKAREAYGLLNDHVAGHFLIAETYYGPRAKKKDLDGGEKELTEIVKRFYSNNACCEALTRRSDLQAGPMKKTDAAIATLRELVDRFPTEANWPVQSLMRIGQLLRGQKKYDEAIVAYEKLILNYGQNAAIRRAWLEIADCYESKGEPEKAIETYKTVLRKFPRTGEASRAHTVLETKYDVADTDVSDR